MTKPQVKFDLSFIEAATKYLSTDKTPTVKGFAESIGTDEASILAWADKKKKDENGNVTDQLARPSFNKVVNDIKNFKPSKEEIKKPEKLNPKQELFCQLYVSDREFFGNGVQTYIEVYEPDKTKKGWYQNACASASEILSNPKVYNRINELLEDGGLNDVAVDKQLQFLIHQHADFSSKVAAIREYNKLRQRITDKMDLSTKGEKITQVVGFTVLPPSQNDGSNNPNTQADK